MLLAVFIITLLAVLIGLALAYAAQRYKTQSDPVVEKINDLLPQTQCGQCLYPGCRPYAQAIANDEADINQCPPGGEATIRSLAALLAREYKPLNSKHGKNTEQTVAVIDEAICIGCTLCIQACPVDAIIGAAKKMHTVLNERCTGCDLCLPPCPVDCIEMQVVEKKSDFISWPKPAPNAKAPKKLIRISPAQ